MDTVGNSYETLIVSEERGAVTIQLYRPRFNNSINGKLISEMMQLLMELEERKQVKVVVLEGLPDHFCTGMDFNELNDSPSNALIGGNPELYYDLLKYLSLSSKIIVSKVEGRVNAGGIGLVAASDMVIAGENATFGLSEALFGLLPACVMPFLVRRIGHQKAQWLALSTQSISSPRAFQIGLVDEVSTSLNDSLRKNLLRLTRLDVDTIKELKDYMSKLWIINDVTKEIAVSKLESLLNSERIQSNIKNFVETKRFPWDKQ